VEHYDNLARLQNARDYDLDIEEQVPVVINNTAHKSKASYCADFSSTTFFGVCGVSWFTCSISNYSAV
jgi:hypothetical protein